MYVSKQKDLTVFKRIRDGMSLMPTAIPGPPESFRRGLCVSEAQCISNLPPVPTRRALFKEGSHSFLSVVSHGVQAHDFFSVCVSF